MKALFSIPNAFSLARIILTLFFVEALFAESNNLIPALLFFSCAVLTDLFDGYVARRYNAMTRWGAFLDPIADKFLVFAAFISFSYKGLVPWWIIGVMVVRDLIVTVLRCRLLYCGKGFKTSLLAKSKTVFQFLSIYSMFAFCWGADIGAVITVLLYAVVGLTIYSGMEYVYHYRQLKSATFIFSRTHEQ